MHAMCGRYVLKHNPAQLQEWYEAAFMPETGLRYNIAPGTPIVTVRDMPDGRIGTLMRWGFIPSWAKDPASIPMLNNARGETVMEKPMFRQAFKRRRCLIPASGFYEWKAVPGQKSKQPFYISCRDGSPMSFAGIWDSALDENGYPIETCAIITTDANDVLAPIHNRMPVILHRHDWQTWLQAGQVDDTVLIDLIRPYDAEPMQAWGVAHAVNKVANDNPELLLPIAQTQ